MVNRILLFYGNVWRFLSTGAFGIIVRTTGKYPKHAQNTGRTRFCVMLSVHRKSIENFDETGGKCFVFGIAR